MSVPILNSVDAMENTLLNKSEQIRLKENAKRVDILEYSDIISNRFLEVQPFLGGELSPSAVRESA